MCSALCLCVPFLLNTYVVPEPFCRHADPVHPLTRALSARHMLCLWYDMWYGMAHRYERAGARWRPGEGWQIANGGDRMSASLLLRRMRQRADRTQIPLFSDSAGMVLRPEATQLLCAYVGDGATQAANCHPPGLTAGCVPGCSHSAGKCDRARLYSREHPWCLCGLDWCLDNRPQPWGAEELDAMITAYLEHGNEYKPSRGFMSAGSEAHTVHMTTCMCSLLFACIHERIRVHWVWRAGRAITSWSSAVSTGAATCRSRSRPSS